MRYTAERVYSTLRKHLSLLGQINFSDSLDALIPCDVLLFCHDVDRGVTLQGKAYSPLIDSIREDLESRGWRCQTISHPWSRLIGEAAWGGPVSMNRRYVVSLLRDRLARMLAGEKGLSENILNLYQTAFDQARPRCIITIGSPPELCLAAKRKGIFHVELLHGMGYKTVEWGWDKRPASQLPDGILSLDDVSTEAFGKLGEKGVQIRQIPHPFIKRFLCSDADTSIPNEWRLPAAAKNNESRCKTILVSLQWGYGGEFSCYKGILKNSLFPDALEDVIRQTEGKIRWWFRLHPVQLRSSRYTTTIDVIDQLCKKHSNAEWNIASTLPLPTILTVCSGQMLMSSMSAYDAACMGVPSLVLCPTVMTGGIFQDWFDDLEQALYVTKSAMTAEAILNWAMNVQKKSPMISLLHDEQAWEGAITWMLDQRKRGIT